MPIRREILVEKEVVKEVEIEKPFTLENVKLLNIQCYSDGTMVPTAYDISFSNNNYVSFSHVKLPTGKKIFCITNGNPDSYFMLNYNFKYKIVNTIDGYDIYSIKGSQSTATSSVKYNTGNLWVHYF